MSAVGDKVMYVPHECHAMDQDKLGVHAWSFAWKNGRDDKIGDVLSSRQVYEKMLYIKNTARRGKNVGQHLIPIAPQTEWPAVVTAVNPNGTCNLDIEYCKSGVTHSYNEIPEDATGKVPHTWHTKGA